MRKYAVRKDTAHTLYGSSPVIVHITRADSPAVDDKHADSSGDIRRDRPRSADDSRRGCSSSFRTPTYGLSGYGMSQDTRRGTRSNRNSSFSDSKHRTMKSPTPNMSCLQVPVYCEPAKRAEASSRRTTKDQLLADYADDSDDSSSCSGRSRSASPFGGIERDNLPRGSPTFQRILDSMLSESDTSKDEFDEETPQKVKSKATTKKTINSDKRKELRTSSDHKASGTGYHKYKTTSTLRQYKT